MLQLIYELRKNWRGRVDGTGRDGWRIEGSTRGPRGPKNQYIDNIQKRPYGSPACIISLTRGLAPATFNIPIHVPPCLGGN